MSDCHTGAALIVHFIYGEVPKRVNMYGMGHGKDKAILICFISIATYQFLMVLKTNINSAYSKGYGMIKCPKNLQPNTFSVMQV